MYLQIFLNCETHTIYLILIYQTTCLLVYRISCDYFIGTVFKKKISISTDEDTIRKLGLN